MANEEGSSSGNDHDQTHPTVSTKTRMDEHNESNPQQNGDDLSRSSPNPPNPANKKLLPTREDAYINTVNAFSDQSVQTREEANRALFDAAFDLLLKGDSESIKRVVTDKVTETVRREIPQDSKELRKTDLYRNLYHLVEFQRDQYLVGTDYANERLWKRHLREEQARQEALELEQAKQIELEQNNLLNKKAVEKMIEDAVPSSTPPLIRKPSQQEELQTPLMPYVDPVEALRTFVRLLPDIKIEKKDENSFFPSIPSISFSFGGDDSPSSSLKVTGEEADSIPTSSRASTEPTIKYSPSDLEDVDYSKIQSHSYLPFDKTALGHSHMAHVFAKNLLPSEMIHKAALPHVVNVPRLLYPTIHSSLLQFIIGQQSMLDVVVQTRLLALLDDPQTRRSLKATTNAYFAYSESDASHD